MKRLQKGVPGVEQRVVPMVGDVDYSDEEEEGQELFAMDAELDPKFMNHYSTDYTYEELNDEQKEIHDALFANPDEEILVGDEGLKDEMVELDKIIKEAKGNMKIKLPELNPKDQERRDRIAKKEKAFYDAQMIPESADEQFFRAITGKQKKIIKFEEKSESEGEEEWGSDDAEEEMEHPESQDQNKHTSAHKGDEFTAEDFPALSSIIPDEEEVGNMKVTAPNPDEDDEIEDAHLENKIKTEAELEFQIKEVLKSEYQKNGEGEKETKILTPTEFDAILTNHIAGMRKVDGRVPPTNPTNKNTNAPLVKPKSILKNKPTVSEPRIEVHTNSSGGTVTFYYGGIKPKESRKTAMVKTGVNNALDKTEEVMKEECLQRAREVAALQGTTIESFEVEEVEGEDMNEDDWEEEDGDEEDDEEGEEQSSEDETNMTPEQKVEKFIRKYRMDERMPIDMKIERDKLLPDMMNGLKVFKRSLLPDIPYAQDIAYQQSLAEEDEDIDYSGPAPEASASIREPLVEFAVRPHVLSRAEAVAGATIVRENNFKKSKGKGKRKEKEIIKKEKEAKAKVGEEDAEEESEDGQNESVAQDPGLVRQKDETPEERKLRKELVKKMKEERKDKKKKFKEKYETLKKGFLTQNNMDANNGGTRGIPVYKIS